MRLVRAQTELACLTMKAPLRLPKLTHTDATSRSPRRPFICSACLQSGFILRRRSLPGTYDASRSREQSGWAQAKMAAQHTIGGQVKTETSFAGVTVDPLRAVAKEMKSLTKHIQRLLGSGHPLLDTVAKYYTQSEGKNVRPLLVLLMSQATSGCSKNARRPSTTSQSTVDEPISRPAILSDENPSILAHGTPSLNTAYTQTGIESSNILPSQRRLAEITELIHTASLLHDDVIDNSISRRSSPSANVTFGNKMAVLAGDFLLGRASVALARLRDAEVIELLATVIANLVEGEFMQLQNTALDEKKPVWTEDTLSYYLQKTYLKTASLISKSCRAAALLGGSSPEVVEAAYSYGRNLGLAFQLIDDMLDYSTNAFDLGKPAGADLELGLATAPLLFAWRNNQQLGVLVGRKFAVEGDVQMAREMVARSDGIEKTRALAQEYADKAVNAIKAFPASEAKDGLLEMCSKTMNRKK